MSLLSSVRTKYSPTAHDYGADDPDDDRVYFEAFSHLLRGTWTVALTHFSLSFLDLKKSLRHKRGK